MKRAIILSILLCSLAQGANEIRAFCPGATTCFSVVREIDGDVWHVVDQQFEVWGTDANDADDYDIALTDKSGGMFVGTFDTNISAGYYHILTHQSADATPDDADFAVWHEWGYWDGNEWFTGITQDVNSIIADVPTTEEIRIEMDANSTDFNTIIADTNELQTDWKNGGRLDLLIDAIKLVTDRLPMTVTTVSDANDANSCTLTAGEDVNDVYLGNTISIQDADDSHWESRMIISWTSARVVVVDEILGFTPAVGDVVVIWKSY